MVQKNVLAMSGRAVEAAGDVDVLLLDKTGTITLGTARQSSFCPQRGFVWKNWPMQLNLHPLLTKLRGEKHCYPGQELRSQGSIDL